MYINETVRACPISTSLDSTVKRCHLTNLIINYSIIADNNQHIRRTQVLESGKEISVPGCHLRAECVLYIRHSKKERPLLTSNFVKRFTYTIFRIFSGYVERMQIRSIFYCIEGGAFLSEDQATGSK